MPARTGAAIRTTRCCSASTARRGSNEKDLKAYLHQLEEAEKRDHRKLGKQLDLFHMQEEAPGLVFWHPKGWSIWQVVEQYMRGVYRESGYQEVRCPQILDVSLWEKSGHWDNYQDNMFFTESEKRDVRAEADELSGPRAGLQPRPAQLSRPADPLRRVRRVHRNEPSGALHGIMRVRGFTQDDGHIFCTEDPDRSRSRRVPSRRRWRSMPISASPTSQLKIALRPEQRIGGDEVWDKAEDALRAALRACGVEWQELPGEGAFYGPKIEYHLKDSLGRAWQVGTMQVDFLMPGRLGAEYVDEDSASATPGHAASGHRRLDGALHRHPDRAPCRQFPGLAGADPGGGHEYHRCAGRLCRRSDANPCKTRIPGRVRFA